MKTRYKLLLLVAGTLLTVNVLLTSLLLLKPAVECQCPVSSKSLPCESVPLSWAVNNYECANSLMAAMNVTNVRFLLPKTPETSKYN